MIRALVIVSLILVGILLVIPNAEGRQRIKRFDDMVEAHDRNLAISLLEESTSFKELHDGPLREELIQYVISVIRQRGYGL